MRFAPMGVAAWITVQAVTAQADSAAAAADTEPTAAAADVAEADEPVQRGDGTAMFTTGLVLTLVGGASMVGGLVYTTAGPADYCPNCASSQYQTLGYAALLGGFASAGVGSVLVIIAGQDDEAEPAQTGLRPVISLGPGFATARFAF